MKRNLEVERAAHLRTKHLENLIDEAGEESFPASDPPAVHTERDPVASGASWHDAPTLAASRTRHYPAHPSDFAGCDNDVHFRVDKGAR
ncbi:MAG: hypothetical protein EPN73_23970 [Paraburkholderia sp.]|jgi:hypothetical protein|uniref:hypothetical protein n=1 Tax=Paraburkholderia sp. TaxID=1926495 RepID=UPI00121E8F84|nr:hypothetical protein [Paraburkholderia sp.]TAL92719.1 MAG: hypothetical protein EPN73_23970 [Paraburkholderia sp.]